MTPDAACNEIPREIVETLLGPSGPEQRFSAEVAERRREYEALVELMMRHAARDDAETEAMARALAAGSLGEQHMWRDLGLPSRATLRCLFDRYFPELAEKNHQEMRWKRFLYKCLCRWEGFGTCRSPSCGECASYAECFAPE